MNFFIYFFLLIPSSYNNFCSWKPLIKINKERIVVRGKQIFVIPSDKNERKFFGSEPYDNVVFLPSLQNSFFYEHKPSELNLKSAGNEFYLKSKREIYVLRENRWMKIPVSNVELVDTGVYSLFFMANKTLYEFHDNKIRKIHIFPNCSEPKSLKTGMYGHFVLNCTDFLYESFDYGKSWSKNSTFKGIIKIVLSYEKCWVKTENGIFSCKTGKRKPWKDVWFSDGILWVLNGNDLLTNSEFLSCSNIESSIGEISDILSKNYIISNGYIFRAQINTLKSLKKTYDTNTDFQSGYLVNYIPDVIFTINKVEADRFVELYSKSGKIYSLFMNFRWKRKIGNELSERKRAYFASLTLNDF